MTKKILGLDLGTNSIGWALVEIDGYGNPQRILGLGSRIIPMGAELNKFEQGQAQTKNANRRTKRGIRRLNKRYKQRRNKLIYILKEMGLLPKQIQLLGEIDNPNKIDRVCIKPIEENSPQLSAIELLELRVKALTEKISLEDLGRLIYKYNQLRGYSGGNAEPEKDDAKEDNDEQESEIQKKRESYIALAKIVELGDPEKEIIKGKEFKKRKIKIEIDEENIEEKEIIGDTYLDVLKLNETQELLINITRPLKGDPVITIKLPNKTSWRKKMENLEKELDSRTTKRGSYYYISEYFLELLNQNKWQKIKDNVVLRFRYEQEFEQIWKTQYDKNIEFKEIVDNKILLEKMVHFIFPNRIKKEIETEKSLAWQKHSKKEIYRKEALENGLFHFIKNQVIYYQRELKDQSHLISFCRFEPNERVIAKSHPVFQEYKIWEQINKLTINTKVENGVNKKGEKRYIYIDRPIPAEYKEFLYNELQSKKEIGFATILKDLTKKYGLREKVDFLNGLDAKSKIKGNDTRFLLKKSMGVLWEELGLEDIKKQIELWDILYNGKGNEYELNSDRTSKMFQFLKNNSKEIQNIEQTAISISKIKFSRNYSSLSLKAIEKIMPLVKAGKYFNNELESELKGKIDRLYNENLTDPFEKAAQEFLHSNIEYLSNGGIINAYATMIVYTRHTEKEFSKEELIKNFNDIKILRQGELRNPLAEQIVNEALVLVKDIWKQYGEKPSEIRLELARELKNSATERAKIHKNNQSNQKENNQIRDRLIEYKQELTSTNIEKLKLWMSQENLQEEFVKRYKDPSKSEIEKMKLWEEQGHVSPYTGKPIPLSALFDKGQYDLDHIIPKSRFFDDSFTNKVICETAVNKDKSNRTAMEYFEIGSNVVELRKKEQYIDEVNKLFFGKKRQNLLATKIPEDPIARQIKETQYIATRTKEELYKIVGNESVKSTTGGVTDYLRNHWGLTDKLKKILKPRYEGILENEKFIEAQFETYKKGIDKRKKEYEEAGQSFSEIFLDKESFVNSFKQNFIQYKNNKLVIKDWSKRIDHRHHAIDALIVACTKKEYIDRLNNLNKELQDWLSKNRKDILPNFEGSPSEMLDEIMTLEPNKREAIIKQIEKFSKIEKPWISFPDDAVNALEEVIVSHKPKDKILIQNSKDGEIQIKLRGQLHQETVYGKSKDKESYKIPLIKFAVKDFATEKSIEKICDEFLKSTIKNHLEVSFKGNKEDAFSAEGIVELNKKLANRRNRIGKLKPHTPIIKIKIYYKNPFEDFSLSKFGSKKFGLKDFEKISERIIDQNIKSSIENFISKNEYDFQNAFSKKGIEGFNKLEEKKFLEKNPDKKYKPINKIKLKPIESYDGQLDNEDENSTLQKLNRTKAFNDSLYVKTGDNYLFAIMEKDEFNKKTKRIETVRVFDLITFYDAAKEIKEAFRNSKDKKAFNKDLWIKKYFEDKNAAKLLFTLKQNDFVYLPDENEKMILDKSNANFETYWNDKNARAKNIYVVQKFSKKQIYFIKHTIASPIANKIEFGSQNCYEKVGERSIKDFCIKLIIDRLGNIVL